MTSRTNLMTALITLTTAEALYLGLRLFTEPGSWIHEFVFRRGPLQWITLGLFLFAVGLLVRRCIANTTGGAPHPGKVSIHRRDQKLEESNRFFGLVTDLAQLMLASGFLGTVLGLSRALYSAFGPGSATGSSLESGLETFKAGLSTALDTTLLALGCALLVTAISTAVRWEEERQMASAYPPGTYNTAASVRPSRSSSWALPGIDLGRVSRIFRGTEKLSDGQRAAHAEHHAPSSMAARR